ncbi:MAG TPA: universal stress protein [Bryobacteraceae bacterium]|jgi:nucleotide-binding universal stress UspA family protein
MFRIKKILLPVDFSDRSWLVIPMAAEFARRFGAEITFLHLAPLFPERLPDAERERLTDFGALHLADIKTHRHVLMSDRDIGRDIADYARDHGMDLIMMSTHGYGPFRMFLFGSVTLKVLHDAECPVWTSAHVEELPELHDVSFRNVVCAIDRSEHSCRLLSWAADFAAVYAAKLTIVHAIPSMATTLGEFSAARWEEEMHEQISLEIAALKDKLRIEAAIEIVRGEAGRAVAQAARETKADLLVAGRSMRYPLAGRLTTDAYSIIRQSTCPVVSL